MAPRPTIPRGVELIVNGVFESQPVVNVFHYRTISDTEPSSTQLEDFVAYWRAAFESSWLEMHSTAYRVLSYTAKSLYGTLPVQIVAYADMTTVGVLGGDVSPGNVAAVISWRTPFGGRQYRGRTYVGPLPEQEVSGNTLGAGLLSNMADFAGLFSSVDLPNGWEPAVVSFTHATIQAITGFVIDYLVDSMRRRLSN
jgi:hypothetical protein